MLNAAPCQSDSYDVGRFRSRKILVVREHVSQRAMAPAGPPLPTWAVQQVGSYLRYTGRDANTVAKAARGPNPSVDQALSCKCHRHNFLGLLGLVSSASTPGPWGRRPPRIRTQ